MTALGGLSLLTLIALVFAHFNYHYAEAQQQQCDMSLWRHVYQPKRLPVIDICKTVSGTIVNVWHMKDGDAHINVKLDPQFENLLKPANYAQQHGYLVVEVICHWPTTHPPVVPYCQNFHQNVNIPPIGTHVTITGSYVLDKEHDNWAEIHPVTSIIPSSGGDNTSASAEDTTSAPPPPPELD